MADVYEISEAWECGCGYDGFCLWVDGTVTCRQCQAEIADLFVIKGKSDEDPGD